MFLQYIDQTALLYFMLCLSRDTRSSSTADCTTHALSNTISDYEWGWNCCVTANQYKPDTLFIALRETGQLDLTPVSDDITDFCIEMLVINETHCWQSAYQVAFIVIDGDCFICLVILIYNDNYKSLMDTSLYKKTSFMYKDLSSGNRELVCGQITMLVYFWFTKFSMSHIVTTSMDYLTLISFNYSI